jgi:uncharacterized membrane protein
VLPRPFAALVLALALGGSGLAAPSAQASDVTVREVPMRAEKVARSVSGDTTVALARPATTVAAYWKGNPRTRG